MRVLLADDHALVRQSLARVLNWEPDIEVVGEAEDGRLAVKLAEQLQPDVVLMDVSMPVMNGLDATRLIRAAHPEIRVIGLSMFQHGEQAQPMLDAGAVVYVGKSDAPDVLLNAIRGRDS